MSILSLQVRKCEIAREICGFTSILSGLLEARVEVKDMANMMEKMEQHMKKITEVFKSKSAQAKEVFKNYIEKQFNAPWLTLLK